MKGICGILLGAACVAALCAGIAGAGEDKYPSKPIRLILGVSPGGAMETAVRQWQPYLQKELGVPIVIDCIPGADGMIGGKVAAEAEPDGYTLIQMPLSFLSAQTLIMNAPYKFDAFEIITNYVNDPMVLMVHKESPWQTLEEFIAYVKSQPRGSVTFGMSSLTAAENLALHAIQQKLDVEFNMVPFSGGNPARLALAGKHIDAMLPGLFGSQSIWDYVRVLAVAQDKNLWPDLTDNAPTINEVLGTDIPNIADALSLFAPAGFREKYPERFKIFSEAFFRALDNPDYKENLVKTQQDGRIRVFNTEDSQKMLNENYELYKKYLYLYENYGKK